MSVYDDRLTIATGLAHALTQLGLPARPNPRTSSDGTFHVLVAPIYHPAWAATTNSGKIGLIDRPEPNDAVTAMQHGADAVVHIGHSPQHIALAVQAAHYRRRLIEPWTELAYAPQPPRPPGPALDLTAEQLAILSALADGDDIQTIAETLHRHKRTIEAEIAVLTRKLNARNTRHAVALATASQVVAPSQSGTNSGP